MSVTRLGLSVFALVLAGSGAAIAGPCDAELAMVRSERPNLAMEGHRRYAECVQKNKIVGDAGPAATKGACDASLTQMRSDRPNLSSMGAQDYYACMQKSAAR